MSGQCNLCRDTDHRATVRSGYGPTVLLSCWVTVSWITIPRANVRLGCCPSGYYPVVLQDCQATVLSGMCPGGSVCRDTVRESPILCGSVHTKCYFYNSLVYVIPILFIYMHGHAACNRSLFKSYYRYVLFLPFENPSNVTNFFLIPSLYLLQKIALPANMKNDVHEKQPNISFKSL